MILPSLVMRLVVLISLALPLVLAACSRAPEPKSRAKAAEPTADGEKDAASAAAVPKPAPTGGSDDDANDQAPERKAEIEKEPSLTRAPSPEGARDPNDPLMENLERQEADFQAVLRADALSCTGALPRRDAVCALAHRICELARADSSPTAAGDCERAQATCLDAQKRYNENCGD